MRSRTLPLSPLPLLALLLSTFLPGELGAQATWQDLVITGGVSAERYRGNLAAVTVTRIDSTRRASAAVGEFGLRGSAVVFNREERTLSVAFDGGLRQFVAGGFKSAAYAPKELVGRVDVRLRQQAGSFGELGFFGGFGGRRVDNRPPMPLFIQPGYGTIDGRVRLQLYPIDDVYYDAQLFGEVAEYTTTRLAPQLALLDRRVVGVEVGASWGTDWTIRAHGGFRASEYRNQGTFDPSDPIRRDKTIDLGATWTLRSSIFAQVGIEGTLNRSNSSRPEYNALTLRAVVSAPIPGDVSLNFFADLTAKEYLKETEFARLVPGEEADNASVVYVEASRPLFLNLDAALRLGWTRAEENIGESYFQRFGLSVLFRYRPFD